MSFQLFQRLLICFCNPEEKCFSGPRVFFLLLQYLKWPQVKIRRCHIANTTSSFSTTLVITDQKVQTNNTFSHCFKCIFHFAFSLHYKENPLDVSVQPDVQINPQSETSPSVPLFVQPPGPSGSAPTLGGDAKPRVTRFFFFFLPAPSLFITPSATLFNALFTPPSTLPPPFEWRQHDSE